MFNFAKLSVVVPNPVQFLTHEIKEGSNGVGFQKLIDDRSLFYDYMQPQLFGAVVPGRTEIDLIIMDVCRGMDPDK